MRMWSNIDDRSVKNKVYGEMWHRLSRHICGGITLQVGDGNRRSDYPHAEGDNSMHDFMSELQGQEMLYRAGTMMHLLVCCFISTWTWPNLV